MKNKRFTFYKADDFREFKAKIFWRTFLMAVLAFGSIILLYSVFLQGNFASWVVAVNQKYFGLDELAARTLYTRIFRNHIDQVFFAAMLVAFFIIFRIYLNSLTRYLMQINQGVDDMGREDTGEVSLPPELSAMERKMNAVKHTLEKQRMDAQLAEQRKNDLLVYLAHDLKTPLASVIGYLNLLHDEEEISVELREKYLAISLDKARHLEDLINEFFEIAQYNLSDITLKYSRINLMRLLEMILYEFQPMLQQKNLNCHLQGKKDIILQCDADKMQRVFDNLLRNAVLYSYEETDIEIVVNEQNGQAEITVTNHGDPISEEHLERIFEQFYRLDVSRNTQKGGAGLGLAIARQIVELHQGTIEAASEGRTVTFKVTLPVA